MMKSVSDLAQFPINWLRSIECNLIHSDFYAVNEIRLAIEMDQTPKLRISEILPGFIGGWWKSGRFRTIPEPLFFSFWWEIFESQSHFFSFFQIHLSRWKGRFTSALWPRPGRWRFKNNRAAEQASSRDGYHVIFCLICLSASFIRCSVRFNRSLSMCLGFLLPLKRFRLQSEKNLLNLNRQSIQMQIQRQRIGQRSPLKIQSNQSKTHLDNHQRESQSVLKKKKKLGPAILHW